MYEIVSKPWNFNIISQSSWSSFTKRTLSIKWFLNASILLAKFVTEIEYVFYLTAPSSLLRSFVPAIFNSSRILHINKLITRKTKWPKMQQDWIVYLFRGYADTMAIRIIIKKISLITFRSLNPWSQSMVPDMTANNNVHYANTLHCSMILSNDIFSHSISLHFLSIRNTILISFLVRVNSPSVVFTILNR